MGSRIHWDMCGNIAHGCIREERDVSKKREMYDVSERGHECIRERIF